MKIARMALTVYVGVRRLSAASVATIVGVPEDIARAGRKLLCARRPHTISREAHTTVCIANHQIIGISEFLSQYRGAAAVMTVETMV